jgi:hypothetical protein
MHDDAAVMKRYYSNQEWERRRKYYEEGPSLEWRTLYHDVYAAIATDPGAELGQALADRWLALSLRSLAGDPDAQTDSMKAWMDRHNWPTRIKRRVDEFHLEEVTDFIKQANLSVEKKYFRGEAWRRFVELRERPLEHRSAAWQMRVNLFRDADLASGAAASGEEGRAIASRWHALMDSWSGGDADVKTGLLTLWQDRVRWSPTLRWRMEALCSITGEHFDRAATFIERAVALQPAA